MNRRELFKAAIGAVGVAALPALPEPALPEPTYESMSFTVWFDPHGPWSWEIVYPRSEVEWFISQSTMTINEARKHLA